MLQLFPVSIAWYIMLYAGFSMSNRPHDHSSVGSTWLICRVASSTPSCCVCWRHWLNSSINCTVQRFSTAC